MDELRALVDSPAHGGDRISAFSAWLDQELNPTITPPASLEAMCRAEDKQLVEIYTGDPAAAWYDSDYEPFSSSRRRAWWTTALFSEDQVRQRLATALSEILVTSSGDSVVDSAHYGHLNYYEMLVAGIPGSYRELLEGVSTHPIMGQYLSSLRNQKEITDNSGAVIVSPDENYAREIMQLFTIGLVRFHPDGSLKLSPQGQPIPTYGQDDIQNLARLFTGWSFSKRNSPSNSETIIDNAVKIREACTALVDHLDLLLCAGLLKADHGTSTDPGNPRETIINMLTQNSTNLDNNDDLTSQLRVRHERYEQAAYLVSGRHRRGSYAICRRDNRRNQP